MAQTITPEQPNANPVPGAENREAPVHPGRVAVLDAGGQYVDMVRKAVERQGLPADVLPLQTPREELEAQYGAIIISGSPASSHQALAPQPDVGLWHTELPILGICYGMQSMVVAHGGQVARSDVREDGQVATRVDADHPLFRGSRADLTALFTHGDFVTELPDGFRAIGQHTLANGGTAYSAIARGTNRLGVQFHPEVFDDTPDGHLLFRNFLHDIAGLPADPAFQETRLQAIIETKRRQIVAQVAGRHVIAFVSGGVDSAVVAALAAPVIAPDKFHAYFIDSGFMRDEDNAVIDQLNAAGITVAKIDAGTTFEQARLTLPDGTLSPPLARVTDPETKRKIIGKTFIDIQNRLLTELGLSEALLLQGTNAADRIESGHSTGDNHTQTIKTHHNQVVEVRELKARGLVLEPLDDLFKYEVRALGRELGLPAELAERQPFPGPGTAIRILAARADRPRPRRSTVEARVQAFVHSHPNGHGVQAHVLPVRSVGVGGDERSHTAATALQHNDSLTTDDLARLATDIPANFRGQVNRVVYALLPGPLDDVHITKTLLTADVRKQLRQADAIMFEMMRQFGVLSKIEQMPVVLLPLSFGGTGQRSIVLRPVTTSTFMTVQALLPGRDLPAEFFTESARRIRAEVPGISQVFADLTNKPPGTTEWE